MNVITKVEAEMLGLKHYFTGKPCRRGHVAERSVTSRGCVECMSTASRKRYEANPEQWRKRSREWRKTNPERDHKQRRESSRRRREKNPENVRELDRKWRAANLEKVRKAQRERYIANIEENREASRNWKRSNPEKINKNNRNRRAQKMKAEGFHTVQDVLAIRERQKDCCNVCSAILWGKGHVDHIAPLKRGGSNWPNNLQLLCEPCNTSKGAKDPFDWVLEQHEKGRLAY